VLRVETTVNNVRDFKAYRFDDQRDPLIREPGGDLPRRQEDAKKTLRGELNVEPNHLTLLIEAKLIARRSCEA
jgi:hypothetical protein